jgi:hypothetical protein
VHRAWGSVFVALLSFESPLCANTGHAVPLRTRAIISSLIPSPRLTATQYIYILICIKLTDRRHVYFAPSEGPSWSKAMTRLIALAFALTVASLAQAMPIAPVQQQDEMVITVREACGAGMHMVNGTCVRTHARRAASRCARGVTC